MVNTPRTHKRTFQVAVFGGSGSGRSSTVRALHRLLPERGVVVPLCDTPAAGSGAAPGVLFFDCELPMSGKLKPTVRFRAAMSEQPFPCLFGCHAMLFMANAGGDHEAPDRELMTQAQQHFTAYNIAWATLPVLIAVTHQDAPSARSLAAVTKSLFDAAGRSPLVVGVNPSTGEGVLEMLNALSDVLLRSYDAGVTVGVATRRPSKAYVKRAQALADAVAIATQLRGDEAMPFEERFAAAAQHPELGFAKISSLAFLENAFFTYWNESDDPIVNKFWQRIAATGLPFRQRDLVREILKRGRIRNDIDIEVVADALSEVGSERLSAAERQQLEVMLRAFTNA